MDTVMCVTRPRVGLLGNPSDGYGGRVLAFTFDDLGASVRLERSRTVAVVAADGTPTARSDWRTFLAEANPRGLDAGADLLAAAVRMWAGSEAGARLPTTAPATLTFETDIPRQVGLSGSSAIIVAALRGLARWCDVTIDATELARLAWRAETEVLGITAGPQDRVVQAHEGVIDMDFSVEPWALTRIPSDLLPPMLLAWMGTPGASSGGAHDDIRARFEAGDPQVVAAMSAFPEFTRLGVECLARGDHEGLRALADRNFDQRASIWTLATEDLEMVELGRAAGAAVKFCGSGGAVVVLPRAAADLERLESGYQGAGYRTLRPTVTATASSDREIAP